MVLSGPGGLLGGDGHGEDALIQSYHAGAALGERPLGSAKLSAISTVPLGGSVLSGVGVGKIRSRVGVGVRGNQSMVGLGSSVGVGLGSGVGVINSWPC